MAGTKMEPYINNILVISQSNSKNNELRRMLTNPNSSVYANDDRYNIYSTTMVYSTTMEGCIGKHRLNFYNFNENQYDTEKPIQILLVFDPYDKDPLLYLNTTLTELSKNKKFNDRHIILIASSSANKTENLFITDENVYSLNDTYESITYQKIESDESYKQIKNTLVLNADKLLIDNKKIVIQNSINLLINEDQIKTEAISYIYENLTSALNYELWEDFNDLFLNNTALINDIDQKMSELSSNYLKLIIKNAIESVKGFWKIIRRSDQVYSELYKIHDSSTYLTCEDNLQGEQVDDLKNKKLEPLISREIIKEYDSKLYKMYDIYETLTCEDNLQKEQTVDDLKGSRNPCAGGITPISQAHFLSKQHHITNITENGTTDNIQLSDESKDMITEICSSLRNLIDGIYDDMNDSETRSGITAILNILDGCINTTENTTTYFNEQIPEINKNLNKLKNNYLIHTLNAIASVIACLSIVIVVGLIPLLDNYNKKGSPFLFWDIKYEASQKINEAKEIISKPK